MKSIIRVSLLLLAATASAVNEPSLLPQPQTLTRLEGTFKLTPATRIYTDAGAAETGAFLTRQLGRATGYHCSIHKDTTPDLAVDQAGCIVLTTNQADAALCPEGYALTVATNRVLIRAPSQAGLFYGVQTLLQLLPPDIFFTNVVASADWLLPCVQIIDWPRFQWRGLMLDVSRHFFTPAEVKQVLDTMAQHKLNTFHWHLTDDQGWRIEIKKYPLLTRVGAWRSGVGFGLATNSTTAYGPDGRYGGFYTQADIRAVVAYAQTLHITIVPEIEMPGHALAALAAYPQFGSGPGPFVVPLAGGVNQGIFSPANEGTFEFLDDVLTEVFQLFPGTYIHVGGDEVPKEPWEGDEGCRALKVRAGVQSAAELQAWFCRRIEKFVSAHGRKVLGWSEILDGGLPKNAAVMDWIGGAKEAASQGHDVVRTPTTSCYLDYYQAQDQANEPRAIGGYVPLEKVYAFEPVPDGLAPEFQAHILGAQGNLWTEYIPNLRQVEYMLYPRACALAEVTWSAKAARNYDDFLRRLTTEEQRLDAQGVNHRRATPRKVGD